MYYADPHAVTDLSNVILDQPPSKVINRLLDQSYKHPQPPKVIRFYRIPDTLVSSVTPPERRIAEADLMSSDIPCMTKYQDLPQTCITKRNYIYNVGRRMQSLLAKTLMTNR